MRDEATLRDLPLAALGDRIVILGPSNAGKSTLAVAIGRALELNVVHLDQLRFLPDTDWEERTDSAFAAMHDDAIAAASWVMEGNYSSLLPARLERATGIVLLRPNRILRLWRYFRRTLWVKDGRLGSLAGGKDSLKWEMIDWIVLKSPSRPRRYARIIRATNKPYVDCTSARAVNRLYAAWKLDRP